MPFVPRMSVLQRQGVIILHDNAGPHTANRICDSIRYCGWEVVQCHLDLTSSDSHLFGQQRSTSLARRLQQTPTLGNLSPAGCLCLTPLSSTLQYQALWEGRLNA